jgi:hypothetical protein
VAEPVLGPAKPDPWEDGNDLDHLRTDPAFKLARGRLPDSGRDLCSQPTISRWENAPTRHEVAAMSYAMIDLYCASYPRPPREVTLDIDDTVDVVHGTQQLSLFNTHHGERCFLPIHVYETATARPVAVPPRSGKTPSGREVRGHVRRIVRRIRVHWPHTRLTIRGDSHAACPRAGRWNFQSHSTVVHSQNQYVKGDAHTNTVEGCFSILKRGIYGVYHHVSEAHLKRYLCEFDFRYSNRIALGVDDVARTDLAIKGIKGKRLTYRTIGGIRPAKAWPSETEAQPDTAA